ncbi:aminoacyl-tRNA deacylase [Weissella tructae]|uniref:Cys-tRNA(Pro)/Cys-tRNA(Cys) deacylase n=2 Tax=Weissella TaxID=46255 RepID=A0A075TX13_9LACO|nr:MULTISPECIES: aminoacyl-tRNA deacylase [Weissella]AIG66114.1 Cys-tRNA(Pro)/Cys-tRNA(Cys) deacylase [Weissella tructae]AIM63494.1 Cys-tRNA(Pro)/Cys-tRNA(Cys) deacylase [Weissella ceti]AIM64829.1 Cys-tRNA(Pro)/Cys-tRNA(Cys) deacylase [Weissella ceti]ELA07487.1 transcriptional regulator [Weissella ceti NC36]QVV91264.1 aminoacyl-tRNA deacylase [Weissella tructae]
MAKKVKVKKILVEQILDKAKIPYESIVFSGGMDRREEELAEHGISEADIYKTLALSGNVTGPLVGIVPVEGHLSEKKLAVVSGNKKVHMLPAKELVATTGYVHGANNPVGIWQTKKFPIYFDNAAKEAGTIVVSAGELGRSIKIDAQALATFVEAEFVDIQSEDIQ